MATMRSTRFPRTRYMPLALDSTLKPVFFLGRQTVHAHVRRFVGRRRFGQLGQHGGDRAQQLWDPFVGDRRDADDAAIGQRRAQALEALARTRADRACWRRRSPAWRRLRPCTPRARRRTISIGIQGVRATGVDHVDQDRRALDVAQEAMPETSASVRAGDQAGHVGQHEHVAESSGGSATPRFGLRAS